MGINEEMAARMQRMSREDVNYGVTPLPIFLCLDASASMSGKRIESLNMGVREFIRSGAQNEDAMDALMLSITVFNGEGVRQIQPLANIRSVQFHDLVPRGGTPFGEAVNAALDLIEEFLEGSTKSYKPYLVVMSDGKPTDSSTEVERTIRRARTLQEKGEIKVRCVMIGADEEVSELARLNIRGRVDRCSDLNITNFFEWLSSMAVEQSTRSLADQDDDREPDLEAHLR